MRILYYDLLSFKIRCVPFCQELHVYFYLDNDMFTYKNYFCQLYNWGNYMEM